jgi:hypothetical protein
MTIKESESQNKGDISLEVPKGNYPEAMKKATSNMEALNESYGRMLFASLGNDKSKVFMFPTPHVVGLTYTSEFLIFTAAEGFKIIWSDGDDLHKSDADFLEGFITDRLGINPSGTENNGTGYKANVLELIRKGHDYEGKRETLLITPNGSIDRKEQWGHAFTSHNYEAEKQSKYRFKLTDANEHLAKGILELNMKRVKEMQKTVNVAAKIS